MFLILLLSLLPNLSFSQEQPQDPFLEFVAARKKSREEFNSLSLTDTHYSLIVEFLDKIEDEFPESKENETNPISSNILNSFIKSNLKSSLKKRIESIHNSYPTFLPHLNKNSIFISVFTNELYRLKDVILEKDLNSNIKNNSALKSLTLIRDYQNYLGLVDIFFENLLDLLKEVDQGEGNPLHLMIIQERILSYIEIFFKKPMDPIPFKELIAYQIKFLFSKKGSKVEHLIQKLSDKYKAKYSDFEFSASHAMLILLNSWLKDK